MQRSPHGYRQMNAEELLFEIAGQFPCYDILHTHSRCVCHKATELAQKSGVPVDLGFVQDACWLHDIGICQVNAPSIQCFGTEDYMCHGIAGAQMLRQRQLEALARVCERHIGVGLTREDIVSQNLPLPPRDFLPETLEEKLVCYADNFFSKNPDFLCAEKSFERIQAGIMKHGTGAYERLMQLHDLFGE